MNVKAIKAVLLKAPLCDGQIVKQTGIVHEFCAMGALARACGASIEYLENTSSDGRGIFMDYQVQLNEKFGITNLNEFQNLMKVNDASNNIITRNKEVVASIEPLTYEELNTILDERTVNHGNQ